MTFAHSAKRAIELGGKYDGHEAPADVNKATKASVAALAGQGLVAAARDNYPRDGMTQSYVASFAEIEVDVETGKYYIVDFLAYADVGTVIHRGEPVRFGSGADRPGRQIRLTYA
jgi:CO/xanthine dehydrogenase Mo-binding subunit